MAIKYIKCVAVAALIMTSASVSAALLGRLSSTPGGTDYQAYYDDQLDITWSAAVNVNGPDTWANHVDWASSYSIDGVTGWRLPNFDVNGDGNIISCQSVPTFACMDNELGYMVWINGFYPMNTGPFSGLDQSGIYASGTEYALDTNSVWEVSLSVNRTPGGIGTSLKSYAFFNAWAVHDGDVVSSVPVPAAAWLFGSGLLGLIGMTRRKKA